jgi:PAS domain S-box-containing protein
MNFTMDKSKNYIKYMLAISLSLITFGFMYYISIINYLIPHTFIELLSATVSMTIFSIGWNTRKYSKNNFMTLLAVGYLLVGILTIFHTLTYKGMGVLPDNNSNTPTQFWTAAHYVESITMLIAVLSLNKKKEINSKLILGLFLFLCSMIIICIFTGIFPDCFLEGTGLTSFKIYSEYIMCSILLFSGYILWKQRSKFEADIYRLILFSIIFTILSEISFTLYTDPYGLLNLIGHFFMDISVILFYISLVKGNLTRPYKSLFKDVADYAEEIVRKNKELEVKDKAIESSLNAIVLTDIGGNITYVNKSFLKLMGYSKEGVLGRSVLGFIASAEDADIAKRNLNTYGSWYGEILLKKKDSKLMHSLVTANYIYSKYDDPICGMASFLDITERKNIEEELIRAKNDAEKANKAKSYFLANMSHEIRTPMNGILGFLQLLEASSASGKQLEYINNIKASSDALLSVINDILDISKIEAGKLELEKIPFDLHSAIENAVMPFTANAYKKGLELNMLIRPEVPRYAIGDSIRLRQVISNLIGNSVKFTQKGYVALEVGTQEEGEAPIKLKFTVEDTGIGISEEALKKLFKPFTQADASSSRRFGGTGLGLAICKSIVHMMGGSIHIESIEGVGTKITFTVSLQEEVNRKQNIDTDYSVLKGKRIMIIDNNPMSRNIAKIYLQEAGCMIKEADTAMEALSKLVREEGSIYNAVLVDCSLPNMSSYDLSAALKVIPSTAKLPLILLTSITLDIDTKVAKAEGFEECLSKPYKQKELLNCVLSALGIKKNEEEFRTALTVSNKVDETDVHKLNVLLAEDNEINRYFLVEILEMKGIDCDIAVNGEEALSSYLSKNYDLIFMDCQMPIMDGYEAARRIREAEGSKKHTIIIAMTANAMKGDAENCLKSGMDDYLSKPVDRNQVDAMIKKHFMMY